MVVTATGLIFITASDGKLRAHDEETGDVLWTSTLPAGGEGILAMYEVNGRQYLVVPATSNLNPGGGYVRPGETVAPPPSVTRGYVVYALPRVAQKANPNAAGAK